MSGERRAKKKKRSKSMLPACLCLPESSGHALSLSLRLLFSFFLSSRGCVEA